MCQFEQFPMKIIGDYRRNCKEILMVSPARGVDFTLERPVDIAFHQAAFEGRRLADAHAGHRRAGLPTRARFPRLAQNPSITSGRMPFHAFDVDQIGAGVPRPCRCGRGYDLDRRRSGLG